jgi:hypothetical protein
MRPNNRPVGKTHQIREDFDPKFIHGCAMGCVPLIFCFIEKVLTVSLEEGLIFFADPLQRRNSWTTFLIKVSRHKLESSQTQVFVWFSTSFNFDPKVIHSSAMGCKQLIYCFLENVLIVGLGCRHDLFSIVIIILFLFLHIIGHSN